MKTLRMSLGATLLVMAPAWAQQYVAPARLTESCARPNILLGDTAGSRVRLEGSPTALARVVEAATNPQGNASIAAVLWAPTSGNYFNGSGSSPDSAMLRYDGYQDVVQIAAELATDPVLRQLGITDARPSGMGVCFTNPPITPTPIVEFFHAGLGHYFLSSSEAETRAVEAGAAGPGWQRTGEVMFAVPPEPCRDNGPVYRFYAAGPNSHFYATDPAECGVLRKPGTGWRLEGIAFGASLPVDGACGRFELPVFRAYNNGAARNDSNHRYTWRPEIYNEMIAQGWRGEGVGFCLPAGINPWTRRPGT